MLDEGIITALSDINTELTSIRIQTVSELGGIKEHLAKLNGGVDLNRTGLTTTREEVAKLQEAKEWQMLVASLERADRIREDSSQQSKLWAFVKANGFQALTLLGVIGVLAESLSNK